jgi:hypothetical protein
MVGRKGKNTGRDPFHKTRELLFRVRPRGGQLRLPFFTKTVVAFLTWEKLKLPA